MDQVTVLLSQYLDYLPTELKEEEAVTGSAINNYVRLGIMPAPVKKKYYRTHIAYLIIICTLKQSLSMAMIKKLLPQAQSEEAVRIGYTAYQERHALSCRFFVSEVREAAGAILDHDVQNEKAVQTTEELIAEAAVISGFAKLLAEKLLLLDDLTLENGGSIEIR